ncbi:unnamed protein product [Blepharisma stoltei]|uniref:Uncharacterized protein n=1 Tax=Blepharisma stoltei TaxID=1481888 RepID=A0AAU9K0A3_9CILI|nr:unnamed protein product [Blepharisma stoltei]
MSELTESKLEEEIENIKAALIQINGSSLEQISQEISIVEPYQDEEYESDEISKTKRNQQCLKIPRRKEENQWELSLLLESEREKNSILQERIDQKDKMLDNLNSHLSDLYGSIEQLQNKQKILIKDLTTWKNKAVSLEEENAKYDLKLKEKDEEIEMLKKDKKAAVSKEFELKEKLLDAKVEADANIKIMQNSIEEIKLKNEKTSKEKEEALNGIAELKQQIKNKESEYKFLQLENDTFREKLQEMDKSVVSLRENCRKSDEKIKNLKNEKARLEQTCLSLKNEAKSSENISNSATIEELYKITGTSNEKTLVSHITHLAQSYTSSKKYKKLVKRITEVIQDVYKSDSSPTKPTCTETWNSLINIIEEYMIFRNGLQGQILVKICQFFNLKSISLIVGHLEQLKKNRQSII